MRSLKAPKHNVGTMKSSHTSIGKTTARAFHTLNKDLIQPVGRPLGDIATIINPAVGIPLKAGVMAIDATDRLIGAGRTAGAKHASSRSKPVKFAGETSKPAPTPYALL